MKIWASIFFLLFLSACGSQLRKPFCENPLPALPESVQGQYEVVAPLVSPSWSGSIALKSLQVELQAKQFVASASVTGLPKWGRACSLDGRLILEEENPNGTYTLVEVTKYGRALVFSPLAIDPDLARKAGFLLHYVPDFRMAVGAGASVPLPGGGSIDSNFILDNSSLSARQVLSVTKPMTFNMTLQSVSRKPFKPVMRVQLGNGELRDERL